MVFCCTGKLFLLPERYMVSHFLYLVENINVIADSYSKICNEIIHKQLVLLDWYLWNYKHYRLLLTLFTVQDMNYIIQSIPTLFSILYFMLKELQYQSC